MAFKEYLEKIIQQSVHVPETDQIYIDQFLDIYLDGTIHRIMISKIISNYPDSCWEKVFVDHKSNYLEFKKNISNKIFDFLKPDDKNTLLGLYEKSQENLFSKLKIDEKEKKKFYEEFPHTYQTKVKRVINTIRKVKRYLFSINATLPAVKDEVNLYDFFLIQVIKTFYPEIYNDIWKNPWMYIPLEWSDETYYLSPFSFLSSGGKDTEKYKRIKEHIENILSKYSPSERDVILNLLETIFFVEVKNAFGSVTGHDSMSLTYRAEKRITHPIPFRKYFMLKASPLEFSDSYIKEIISQWEKETKEKAEEKIIETFEKIQKEGKLLNFINALMIFRSDISDNIIIDLIRAIYKYAENYAKTENWNNERSRAAILLLFLINDRINVEEINEILQEVILETSFLAFSVAIVLYCKKDRAGEAFKIKENVDIESLKELMSKKLEEHFIVNKNNIFEEYPDDWSFILYQWATNWMDGSDKNKQKVNEYAYSLLEKSPKLYEIFILKQRVKPYEDELVINYNDLKKAYDVKRLAEIGEKHIEKKNISTIAEEIVNKLDELIKRDEGGAGEPPPEPAE